MLIPSGVGKVGPSSEEAAESPTFSDLFNARCEELGLLSAPEIAQRISAVQPAAGNVDLARSVRNWQAGRNVPRSDFYRIILQALEIDGDDAQRTLWHRAYGEAKAKARAPSTEEISAPSASPAEPSGDSVRPAANNRSPTDRATPSSRGPFRFRPRWAALATVASVLIVAGLSVGRYAGAGEFGASCDAAAGAHWDPQRNPAIEAIDFQDIRASAIEACEGVVREHPRKERYWFQLGRAHDRDAKWHGNYAAAYWAFRRAHELGSTAAALSLGMLHEDGLTGTGEGPAQAPDLRKAATFYEQAAASGLPMGLYCHAIASLFGWSGGRPDPSGAMGLAEAAAAAGSNRALGLVADLKAKKPRTRHVECSQEYGVDRAPQTIAWD